MEETWGGMHIHYLHQGRQDILSEHDKPRLVVDKLYLHTPTCITWLLNLAYHPPNAHILSDIFPTCTILYYNIFNHLEDKLFPLITTAQEWDHSHSAWDGCSMFAETLWDWYCFLAGIHSVNKIDAARYQHPPQAWYQGQLTFMPSISYLYIVLVCELFRIHE